MMDLSSKVSSYEVHIASTRCIFPTAAILTLSSHSRSLENEYYTALLTQLRSIYFHTMPRDVDPHPGLRHDTPNAVNTSHHGASLPSVACLNTSSSLSVFYLNARSIVNKRSLLNLELATNLYDIIILTQTH